MSRSRERWLAATTVLLTVATVLVSAEVALRFLPVNTGFRTVAVTAANPVFHFTANRDFVFSRDWNLALANRGHVNNAGFVNDQDYRAGGEPGILGVVGDSYIEAAMLPFAQTLQARLAKGLGGRLRVYSFAASGAPLSQYLIWARHAVHDFGASALVINIVGNDFDESLAAYGFGPGFWLYVPDRDGSLKLRLTEYHPGALRSLVLASALARYMIFNLNIGPSWVKLKSMLFPTPAHATPRYAGNTSANVDPVRIRDSLAVVDAFFRDLPDLTGLPPNRVLFTMDGARYPNAAASQAGTYFDRMRTAFRAKAESLGYEVIDLDPWFFEDFRQRGERFEWPQDGHWNGIGHEVAAKAILASKLVADLTGDDKNGALPNPR